MKILESLADIRKGAMLHASVVEFAGVLKELERLVLPIACLHLGKEVVGHFVDVRRD